MCIVCVLTPLNDVQCMVIKSHMLLCMFIGSSVLQSSGSYRECSLQTGEAGGVHQVL